MLKSLLYVFNIYIYCTQNWTGYGQAGLTPMLFNFYCPRVMLLVQLAKCCFFININAIFYGFKALVGLGFLIVEVSISHSDTLHSVGLLWV